MNNTNILSSHSDAAGYNQEHVFSLYQDIINLAVEQYVCEV